VHSGAVLDMVTGCAGGKLPGVVRNQPMGIVMFSSILEDVLAGLLAVAVLGAAGSLWYADHEHAKLAPLQLKMQSAQNAANQAAADRDTALKAAADAQSQLVIAETALGTAQATATAAASDATAAHAKLAQVAKLPGVVQTLDVQLPKEVWDAIYNATGAQQ